MRLLSTRLLRIIAALAFLAFGGELIADAISDSTHGCVAEASQGCGDEGDCAACLTCCHGVLALTMDRVSVAIAEGVTASRVLVRDEDAHDGPPSAIDHPPQLS